MKIVNLPPSKIRPDKNQPRQTLDESKIQEMAQSIKTEGVINPIEIDENNIIITGELRWRAAKLAGLKEVPCKVLKIKPEIRFRRQVIENIHHNTMTDTDTARALERLIQGSLGTPSTHGGPTDKGINRLSRMIGKSKRFIIDHLEILKASRPIQEAISKGDIHYTVLRALRRAPKEFKDKLEAKILRGELRTRDAALEVETALKRRPNLSEKILAIDYGKMTDPEVREAIEELVPSPETMIEASFAPSKQLSKITDLLLSWLQHNSPHSLGIMHLPDILLNLTVADEAIRDWGKLATKQLKGKNGN